MYFFQARAQKCIHLRFDQRYVRTSLLELGTGTVHPLSKNIVELLLSLYLWDFFHFLEKKLYRRLKDWETSRNSLVKMARNVWDWYAFLLQIFPNKVFTEVDPSHFLSGCAFRPLDGTLVVNFNMDMVKNMNFELCRKTDNIPR